MFNTSAPSKIITIHSTEKQQTRGKHEFTKPIVIGTTIAAIAAFLLSASAAFFIHRRRRRKQAPDTSELSTSPPAVKLPDVPEAGGSSRAEMDAMPEVFEVDNKSPRWVGIGEQDSGYVGHEIDGKMVRLELATLEVEQSSAASNSSIESRRSPLPDGIGG